MVTQGLKILIISPEYPPHNIGGGGIAFQNIAETLVNKGHHVQVLSGDYTYSPDALPHQEVINNINVIRFALTKPLFQILRNKTAPSKVSKTAIKSHILNNKYDYAIIFGSFEMMSVYCSKILFQQGIPYIIHSHGYFMPNNYSILLRIIFKVYEKLFLIPMFKKSIGVLSVNPDQTLPVKSEYLPNGINAQQFSIIKKHINIREVYNIPKENFIIFSIGRLHEHKGFQYVIEAIKELPNITYIIAGPDDGYLKKLKMLSHDMSNINFTGKLDHDLKKNYYEQSDIHILPSTEESFGIVILEAMAFGLPSIVSRVGGMKTIIEDGVNGLVVSPQSAKEIKDAIVKVKNNGTLLTELRKNAKKSVEGYSWNYVADFIINYFKEHEKRS